MNLVDIYLRFIDKMNKKGVPLPMVRDPKTGEGSVTLTFLVVSGTIVIISLLNSFAQLFKGVDVDNALEFFLISLGGYLGRKFQGKVGSMDVPEKKE